MKIVLILAATLVACVAAQEKQCPLMPLLMANLKECTTERRCTEEMNKNVENADGSDEGVNCCWGCLMEKADMLKAGKLDFAKIEEVMKSDPKSAEGVMMVLKKCREDGAEKTIDPCQVAGSYLKCVDVAKNAMKTAA